MSSYNLSHLKQLEHEAIYVMREVAAQFERPVLMFSGGKDSIVMVKLAQRAFFPAAIPFPLLHIDTGHNFDETIEFRDWLVKKVGARLIVRTVQDSIDKGRCAEEKGVNPSRNALQTVTLLDALEELRADAAIGGARRDEEKARAKERFFSHRDEFGQWDPKNQRPELWNIFNGRIHHGEHFRVFPLSNWTEMDIWQYIATEKIEIPSLYFSHRREIVNRKGILLANSPHNTLLPEQKPTRNGQGPFPHRGRCHLHRRGRVAREQPGGNYRGSGGGADHRAGSARGRQAERERDGRPQKGRIFLTRSSIETLF